MTSTEYTGRDLRESDILDSKEGVDWIPCFGSIADAEAWRMAFGHRAGGATPPSQSSLSRPVGAHPLREEG